MKQVYRDENTIAKNKKREFHPGNLASPLLDSITDTAGMGYVAAFPNPVLERH